MISLYKGALLEVLNEKRQIEIQNGQNPNFTHLTVTLVDELTFGDLNTIIKIWPPGHFSPISHKGGCTGTMKCLRGPIKI